jgi:hypothetical protein
MKIKNRQTIVKSGVFMRKAIFFAAVVITLLVLVLSYAPSWDVQAHGVSGVYPAPSPYPDPYPGSEIGSDAYMPLIMRRLQPVPYPNPYP